MYDRLNCVALVESPADGHITPNYYPQLDNNITSRSNEGLNFVITHDYENDNGRLRMHMETSMLKITLNNFEYTNDKDSKMEDMINRLVMTLKVRKKIDRKFHQILHYKFTVYVHLVFEAMSHASEGILSNISFFAFSIAIIYVAVWHIWMLSIFVQLIYIPLVGMLSMDLIYRFADIDESKIEDHLHIHGMASTHNLILILQELHPGASWKDGDIEEDEAQWHKLKRKEKILEI
ncbi:hypothetical protein ACJX0J_012371 [Zea mays]